MAPDLRAPEVERGEEGRGVGDLVAEQEDVGALENDRKFSCRRRLKVGRRPARRQRQRRRRPMLRNVGVADADAAVAVAGVRQPEAVA